MEQEIIPQLSKKNNWLFAIVFSVLLTAVTVGLGVYLLQKSVNEKVIQILEQKISVLEQQISTKDSAFEYVQPESIIINGDCLKSQYIKGMGEKISVTCNQVGEVVLSPLVKAVLKFRNQEKILTDTDFEFDVYLEFYKDDTVLNVPPYYFSSFVDANVEWFSLSISYLDENNIYISDSGGHEGYPEHYFFNGTSWSKFFPWDLVKNVFPDTIQPPFSVLVSQKYIKIIEQKYCCDQSYGYTPDREANRLVFVLDRISKKIIEISKTSR